MLYEVITHVQAEAISKSLDSLRIQALLNHQTGGLDWFIFPCFRVRQVDRLAAVVEQAAEDVVITDSQGNIQYVNPRFQEVTGYIV